MKIKPDDIHVKAFDECVAIMAGDEHNRVVSLSMDADDAELVAKEILKMVEKARKSPYYKKK